MYLHHLETQHFDELTQGSKIDVQLAQLNFISLQSSAAYDYLLISDRIPRTNIGMVQNKWLQTYFHVAKGGWWCSGLDPVNKWQVMEWGCFKPNQPRYNKKGKLIKYEHPPFTPTRVFCFRITLFIFQKIVQRYNLKLPKNIEFSLDGGILGFWQWVVETNIPIIICEGLFDAIAIKRNAVPLLGKNIQSELMKKIVSSFVNKIYHHSLILLYNLQNLDRPQLIHHLQIHLKEHYA